MIKIGKLYIGYCDCDDNIARYFGFRRYGIFWDYRSIFIWKRKIKTYKPDSKCCAAFIENCPECGGEYQQIGKRFTEEGYKILIDSCKSCGHISER